MDQPRALPKLLGVRVFYLGGLLNRMLVGFSLEHFDVEDVALAIVQEDSIVHVFAPEPG